jgi:hypothetical protein
MKRTLIIAFIIVLTAFIFCCKKDIPNEENPENGNISDTISNPTDTTGVIPTDTIIDPITNPSDTITEPVSPPVDTITNPITNPTDTITDPGNTGGNIDTIVAAINRKDTLTLSFQYGEDGTSPDWTNIYVVWLEAPNFIQNMFVCQKLIKGGLTGTALPYWKVNKYPQSSKPEIDAVTSATIKNVDFAITKVIKDSTLKSVTVNFETDRSFDPNDWFDNQPAILYSATINLEDTTSNYELLPIGWTPNEGTQNQVDNTPMGKLQNEMRYITHYKNGSVFGDKDQRGATKMVKKISVHVK